MFKRKEEKIMKTYVVEFTDGEFNEKAVVNAETILEALKKFAEKCAGVVPQPLEQLSLNITETVVIQ